MVERGRSLNLDTKPFVFGPDFNPLAIKKFIRFFGASRTDIVITNVSKDLRTAGIAARLCNIPTVQRIGLPGDIVRKGKVRLLHHWIRPHYLVPCRYIKTGFLQNLPFVRSEHVTVIPSAKQVAENPPVTVGTPLRLVTTSQLNPDKGHGDVLKALAILKEEGFSFQWHVAGTGSEEARLHSLAGELDLQDRISWHGFVHNIRELLAESDVFILPSYKEGLPNTLLEALSEGVIPLCYNVGGIAEVFPQGGAWDRHLVPVEHGWKGIADSLRTIFLSSPERLVFLKAAAWKQAKLHCNIETRSQELETWLSTLLLRTPK